MTTNNVVKLNFPRSKRSLPGLDLNTDKTKRAIPKIPPLKGVFAWLWLVVRWPVFLVLYWLRMPILMACNLVSVPLLFCFIFGMFALPEYYRSMVWGVGCMSFAAFALHWAYDSLLMWISPSDIIIPR